MQIIMLEALALCPLILSCISSLSGYFLSRLLN